MNLLTANSLCLAPLATAFQNDRVTVEQYFDVLLVHVTINGLVHDDDLAGPKSRDALTSLVTSDAVCGAFRMWMLNSAYPKLKPHGMRCFKTAGSTPMAVFSARLTRRVDVGPLKQVLLAAWEAGNFPELQQRGSLVSPASPQVLQVLVAIAFSRRMTEPLQRALALAKQPPDETIFDLMNLDDLPSDYKSLSAWHRVLRSGWIHPVPVSSSPRARSTRAAGWTSMVERGLTDDIADSPVQLAYFLRALRDNSIVPTLLVLCRLVEKGATKADRMAVFCDVFPARRLRPPANPDLHVSQAHNSPNALLRAASLSPLPQEEKCSLLEVLLRQGLDPNWVPKAYMPTRQFDFRTDLDGWYKQRDETETALHVAVARGEADVVRLLLRNKAKTDIKDGQGRMALDRLSAGSCATEIRDALQTVRKPGWFGSW